jgi:pimeloyl-ACP methyl ester carboxylesterase
MNETVFEIAGADGLFRRGVLTPAWGGVDNARVGVVLLPAGLKYHVGSSRLNVLLARELAAAGYLVLRFDPLGLGESDGSLGSAPVRALWRSVEQGRFVDDTLFACRALRRRYGVEQVVACGLCGGAITAQLAASRAPDQLNGVVSLNTAVTLSPVEPTAVQPVSAMQARHHMKSYLQKLMAPAAWDRLLHGESDFAAIRATVLTTVKARFARANPGANSTFPNENPAYIESFRTLEHKRVPHLLVFSGNDNRWLEYQEIVLHRYLGSRMAGEGYEIRVVADANHEFHWKSWQREAIQLIGDWLGRSFACGAGNVRAVS